jgi:superkiller protein 3
MSYRILKEIMFLLFLTLFIAILPSVSCAEAEKKDKDAGYYFNLGNNYNDSGNTQEAIDAYKEAIKIKPDLEEAYYNLGVTYGKLDMYKEAITVYKQALRINPENVRAHYNLGIAYLNTNKGSFAFEEYKILKDLDPQQAHELFNLIEEYSSQKGLLSIP